ncbi:GntR family transcriptional regulator [Acidovorax sp. GBBC 3334]|uniref:GntR family transcriptional regulator n=1 Tax=Acidovorax sp. GBBC 3334 TaxID=2940496 RepID=UPI0023044A65|nr:GntR family transcriptional regulator [Acidovorax sp. GBBC 3334]MDA8455022.1 GntR family transcriptional regulator [Acidovorax sp. GBBC 3334]
MHVREKVRLDRSRHAAPQVFEKLREAIVNLDLAPGTVLARAELAERFGISQTPVRDALLRLGEEGLVDIFPQHATVVSRIDVPAARQAHYLRRSIELEVVRTLALEPAEATIARLRAQIEAMAAMAGPQTYREFVEADQGFHRLMYEAAGVPGLWDLVRRRSGHVDRLRRLHLPTEGKAQAVLADHRRIADAIAAGDAPAAQEALRAHLSGTLSQVEEICARYPEFVET